MADAINLSDAERTRLEQRRDRLMKLMKDNDGEPLDGRGQLVVDDQLEVGEHVLIEIEGRGSAAPLEGQEGSQLLGHERMLGPPRSPVLPGTPR